MNIFSYLSLTANDSVEYTGCKRLVGKLPKSFNELEENAHSLKDYKVTCCASGNQNHVKGQCILPFEWPNKKSTCFMKHVSFSVAV